MKLAGGDNRPRPKPQRTTTVFLKTVDTLLKAHTIETQMINQYKFYENLQKQIKVENP